MTVSTDPVETLKRINIGLQKELHTYYLNHMKQTLLITRDLSHAYQPCIKF